MRRLRKPAIIIAALALLAATAYALIYGSGETMDYRGWAYPNGVWGWATSYDGEPFRLTQLTFDPYREHAPEALWTDLQLHVNGVAHKVTAFRPEDVPDEAEELPAPGHNLLFIWLSGSAPDTEWKIVFSFEDDKLNGLQIRRMSWDAPPSPCTLSPPTREPVPLPMTLTQLERQFGSPERKTTYRRRYSPLESQWRYYSGYYARSVIAPRVLLPVMGAILFVALAAPLRRRRLREYERCAVCEYPTEGLTSPHCPECGADLTTIGVYPQATPKYRYWLARIVVWTAVMFVVMVYFSNDGIRHIPQPYNVTMPVAPPIDYVEGEGGHPFEVLVTGQAFRWPWQEQLTADVATIAVNTRHMMPQPMMDRRRLTWHRAYHSLGYVELRNNGTVKTRTAVPDFAFTTSMLEAVLQPDPEGPPPTETVRRISEKTSTTEVVTAYVRRNYPDNVARASPTLDYKPRPRAIVVWSSILIWAVGLAWLMRRWRRKARQAWTPPT